MDETEVGKTCLNFAIIPMVFFCATLADHSMRDCSLSRHREIYKLFSLQISKSICSLLSTFRFIADLIFR